MAEKKMTEERAEKVLGLKTGEIKRHKDELKQMKAEMVEFVLTYTSYTPSDMEGVEFEIDDTKRDEAEQIVLGLLKIGHRYGMAKIFEAEYKEDI